MALAQTIAEHLEEYFAVCGEHNEPQGGEGLYRIVLREVERPLMQKALEIAQGNQTRAATLLGMHRNTFRKKMVELGLE